MKNRNSSHYNWTHYKVSLNDWLLHLVVTPSLIILANYWLLGKIYFSNAAIFLSTTIIASLVASILSVINMRFMFAMRRKYPKLNQTFKRLMSSLAVYATSDFLGCMVILLCYTALPFLPFELTLEPIIKTTVLLLISATIAGLGYEFSYSFAKWKESILENEKLKLSQAQAELSLLKSQVNPHFLFNSLNCLSSLISENAEKAEYYVNEMTKVYRYLIRNNEIELTPLASELQFIHSYFHLLKTRYGQGIEMQISILPEHSSYLLPPLTLQLLVENAVKHNAVLKDSPLIIKLYSNTNNELIVTNNLQKKKLQIDSTKIGLNNIASKYKLMNQTDIQIQQTTTSFTVTLPLIPDNVVSIEKPAEMING